MQRNRNFQSLALSDLVEARAHYHVHLTNKANVVGTAVGLYLIRNDGVPPDAARTFANSGVRDDSWPCVLVMVSEWQTRDQFNGSALAIHDLIPPTLYMPDGRTIPVCVVEVRPSSPSPAGAAWRYAQASFGPGVQLSSAVQGAVHFGTAGCLVTDGRLTYALTNRHVAGGPGRISATIGTASQEIGSSSDLSVAKRPFHAVYPAFPDDRALLNLDAGLVELDRVESWRPDNIGLGVTGPLFDLNEYNIGVSLIDTEVVGFGAATGRLEGKIKALFYRYKSVGGYDYVSDFLIEPATDAVQAHPGDSGAIWHVPAQLSGKPIYQPLAMEWGGQGVHGQSERASNFSLATSLSAIFAAFDVDLVTSGSSAAAPFWGAMGHYAIGELATTLLTSKGLRDLMTANSALLTPPLPAVEQRQYVHGDFVPLCDVPDLVWKNVVEGKTCGSRKGAAGGRDIACDTGPEHPNHFADVDMDGGGGTTFLEQCIANTALITEQAWLSYYLRNGHTQPRDQGCLPFRCKQIFNAMLDALARGDLLRFLCASGVLAHYVGDACQPLHCSQYADGDQARDRVMQEDKLKSWYGKGVHSTYEDDMVELKPDDLFSSVKSHLQGAVLRPVERTGDDAATRSVLVMSYAFGKIRPMALVDAYVELGGKRNKTVAGGLYDKFADSTADIMAEGARALAELWEAAWQTGGGETLAGQIRAFTEDDVRTVYTDTGFVKSMTLKQMIDWQQAGSVLK